MAATAPLRRSAHDRVIAGVLGGVAEHFGLDPTLVRVVYTLASLLSAGFPGVLIYLICWLVIPESEY
jgi:phage shock protein PspC (stress-responsive transcriptional regulator)